MTDQPIVAVTRATEGVAKPAREGAPLRHYIWLVALLAALGLLMVYPLVSVTRAAFVNDGQLSLFWFRAVLGDKAFTAALVNSLLMAVVVTALANGIAVPLAVIQSRFVYAGKKLWGAMILVPLVLPPFVGAVGMRQLLGRYGSLTILLQHLHCFGPHQGYPWLEKGGFWAVAVMVTLGLYPVAYLNLQAALANIDPAMLEAAENLGGSRLGNFFRVTLPLAMPGIFAGSTIVFIWAFTELGTPLLLHYRNLVSQQIFDQLSNAGGGTDGTAFAQVSLVLAITAGAYVVSKLAFGRGGYAMTSKAATASAEKKLGWAGSMLAGLPFLAVTFMAVLPHLGVILYSVTAMATETADQTMGWSRTLLPTQFTLAGYRTVFADADIRRSILNSLEYASASTALDLVLGIAIAWVLVRTRVLGRSVLDALSMLPLAVPGLVMAFGYIAMTNRAPFTVFSPSNGSPFLLLAVAYAVRRLPYLVRSAAGGLEQTSVTLEEAAASLGGSPWRTLWKITLPLIMANLIAGGLLTFSFAMLEVSDSLILAPLPEHFPITKQIYALAVDNTGAENVRNACALGVLAMGLLVATIAAATALLGKRLGALFRV